MWLAPFTTEAIERPDQSLEDIQAETVRLFERQRAIDALLRGEVDAEFVLDMLAEQEIDPTAYVDCVQSNLEFLCPGLPLEL
jgi:hypothetical protein